MTASKCLFLYNRDKWKEEIIIDLKLKHKILIPNDDIFQVKMIDMIFKTKIDVNTLISLNGKVYLDILKQFITDYQN